MGCLFGQEYMHISVVYTIMCYNTPQNRDAGESMESLKYIDLFCGIGGFRIATENVCKEKEIEPVCVFSSDIDSDCQITYKPTLVKDQKEEYQSILRKLRPNGLKMKRIVFSSPLHKFVFF